MHEIEIQNEAGLKINYQLTEPSITLQNLEVYFSSANGLTYEKDGKCYCLVAENDRFQLNANIVTNKVFCSEENLCKQVTMTEKKKAKFNEILSCITKGGDEYKNELKKESIPKTKIGLKTKTVKFGWKHRDSSRDDFIKIEKPLGGNKHVTLESAKMKDPSVVMKDYALGEKKQKQLESPVKIAGILG